MPTNKIPPVVFLVFGTILSFAFLFALPTQVLADAPYQSQVDSQCLTCHEDLYYLHDSGKSFCIQDAPMLCEDCHEGNPAAITPETAHSGLISHPILNEDDSKCYQCHPVQAGDRVEIFKKIAGTHPVLVAKPYDAADTVASTASLGVVSQSQKYPVTVENISLLVLVGSLGFVLIAYKILH
jgi:hypothetical protein